MLRVIQIGLLIETHALKRSAGGIYNVRDGRFVAIRRNTCVIAGKQKMHAKLVVEWMPCKKINNLIMHRQSFQWLAAASSFSWQR